MEELCRRLVKYDGDIVEIIQFGSSVYAPEYSRDVDLLVITRRAKDYSKGSISRLRTPKTYPLTSIYWSSAQMRSLARGF